MKLSDSHPGGRGPTLIEKIRAAADLDYAEWMDGSDDDSDITLGRVEGMCAALGILCGTKEELQFDSVAARYDDRKRREGKEKEQER